ncbi:MAG: YajG family lipoprotein [Proteobacteria bacterium]|nr:YajG family lipoprotein [Pseudomonadota bacterium]
MNRLLLITCLFLLVGCAKQPVIANLNPRLVDQPVGIYTSGLSAMISGQDARKSTEVIIFINDVPASRMANVSAPVDLISARLAKGLRDQGLAIDPSSPVRLKFIINELLVRVTHQNLLYTAEAKTHIYLTVENRGAVFTRVFKREANNDSATRPDLPDLEGMLNTQLVDIMQQIIEDEEIRQLISRK